jgi:hypothetical protein
VPNRFGQRTVVGPTNEVNVGVRELPPDAFHARVMIDGVRHTETFVTRQAAEDWQVVTRARAITGSLPGRLTVREYSVRWLQGYAPCNISTDF